MYGNVHGNGLSLFISGNINTTRTRVCWPKREKESSHRRIRHCQTDNATFSFLSSSVNERQVPCPTYHISGRIMWCTSWVYHWLNLQKLKPCWSFEGHYSKKYDDQGVGINTTQLNPDIRKRCFAVWTHLIMRGLKVLCLARLQPCTYLS